RRCQLPLGHTRRTEGVMVAGAGVLLGGSARGAGLPGAGVRERAPGAHQPLCGARAFALEPWLHPAPDQVELHPPLLAVWARPVGPRSARESLAPLCHRWPRGFRAPSTPYVLGQRGLQIAHRGGAGPPQPIALTARAPVVTQPRVAPQCIVTRAPA